MKKFMLLLVFIIPTLFTFAQDVIVKKDGTTIQSKIFEVGTTEIKYKKWNHQDGPFYIINKADVKAINYENGDNEVFDDVIVTQQPSLDNNDYSAQLATSIKLQKEQLLASAKAWNTVGNVWFLVNFVSGIGYGGYLYVNGAPESTYWIVAGAGAASAIIGAMICWSISNNKAAAANSVAYTPIINKDFNIANNSFSASVNMMHDKYTQTNSIGLGLSYKF